MDTASARSLVDRSIDRDYLNADLDGELLRLWHFDSEFTTLSTLPLDCRQRYRSGSERPSAHVSSLGEAAGE